MDVLLIAPQPFFAERGTPIAVRCLAEALCADGHRVDLLTYPFGDDLEVDGLTIHRCGRFPGVRRVGIGFSLSKLLMDLMLLLKLYSMGKPGRYRVVHAVEESVYGALLLRWRHRASVIYDMDSSLADQLADSHAAFRVFYPVLSRLERWAIRSAELVVPMCHDLADYAAKMRDGQGVVVLHDVPLASGDAKDPVECLSDAQSAARCLALYVGNLESYQGIDLLVDAVELLPADCPVRVVVVGGPAGEVERFRAIASRRGLDDRMRFVGPRPIAQLDNLLAQADILLSPRTKGGNTPLKLYSYMDSGRAILATRLRTHTQVLDDSTAFLVEPEADDYSRGLRRLVGDEELRRSLGASARRRVTHDYSLSSFSERVRDIYPRSQELGAHAAKVRTRIPREPSTMWARISGRRGSGDRRSGRVRRMNPRSGIERRAGERRLLANRRVVAYA